MSDDEIRPHGTDRGSFTGTTIYLLLGPIVWAVHLLVIYGPQPTLCMAVAAAAFGPWTINIFVFVATAAAVLVTAVPMVRPAMVRRLLRASSRGESETQFQDRAMRLLCLLSIVGMIWAGAAAALIAPCLPMR